MILHNPSEEEIIAAIELNNYSIINMYKKVTIENVEIEENEHFIRVTSGIPFFLLNGMVDARIPEEEADATIKETIAYFKAKNLPFSWPIGPLSTPKNIKDLLTQNGLANLGGSPGMALNLISISRNSQELVPNVKISKIESGNDGSKLQSWCDIWSTNFGLPKFVADFFREFFIKGLESQQTQLYLFIAYLNGDPVATSMVLYGAGVAGIYNITTSEDARKKGVGKAITLASLYEAKDRGYEIAVLGSSEMGFNLYTKLGFKEYCTMYQFMWTPDSND